MGRKLDNFMEFLMTYGWAILVMLIAIGALAYFGVISPEKLLPKEELNETWFIELTDEQKNGTPCIEGGFWDEKLKKCIKVSTSEVSLLDLNCRELEDEFKELEQSFLKEYKLWNVIINLMILKECEIKEKKTYYGKCASEERASDREFERGNTVKIEEALEAYNKCMGLR